MFANFGHAPASAGVADGPDCCCQVHLDEITVVVGALGSITLTPLLHNTVRKPGNLRRLGHWAMSAFWTVILVSHQLSSSVFRNDICPASGVITFVLATLATPNRPAGH